MSLSVSPLPMVREDYWVKTPYERFMFDLQTNLTPEAYMNGLSGVNYNNSYNLQWENPIATQRFYQTLIFHGNPDAIDTKRHGRAWWNKPRGRTGFEFKSICICDSHHVKISKQVHTDTFRLSIWINLRECVRDELQRLIHCACYSVLNHVVSVDVGNYNEGVVLLAIIKLWNDDKLTCDEVKEKVWKWPKLVEPEFQSINSVQDPRSIPCPRTEIFERYLAGYM